MGQDGKTNMTVQGDIKCTGIFFGNYMYATANFQNLINKTLKLITVEILQKTVSSLLLGNISNVIQY
jgi:hypothetical protein